MAAVYLISTQGCSLNLGLMVRLDHLISESQGSVMVSLMHDTTAGFSMGVLWLTLLSACRACILSIEPSSKIK